MKIYSQALYIKRINLQDEARLIKRRERKLMEAGRKIKGIDTEQTLSHRKGMILKKHRLECVREAAREAHLAHGFLTGRPYSTMEHKTYSPPSFDGVLSLALRILREEPISLKDRVETEKTLKETWVTWLEDATTHISAQREEDTEEAAA